MRYFTCDFNNIKKIRYANFGQRSKASRTNHKLKEILRKNRIFYLSKILIFTVKCTKNEFFYDTARTQAGYYVLNISMRFERFLFENIADIVYIVQIFRI